MYRYQRSDGFGVSMYEVKSMRLAAGLVRRHSYCAGVNLTPAVAEWVQQRISRILGQLVGPSEREGHRGTQGQTGSSYVL